MSDGKPHRPHRFFVRSAIGAGDARHGDGDVGSEELSCALGHRPGALLADSAPVAKDPFVHGQHAPFCLITIAYGAAEKNGGAARNLRDGAPHEPSRAGLRTGHRLSRGPRLEQNGLGDGRGARGKAVPGDEGPHLGLRLGDGLGLPSEDELDHPEGGQDGDMEVPPFYDGGQAILEKALRPSDDEEGVHSSVVHKHVRAELLLRHGAELARDAGKGEGSRPALREGDAEGRARGVVHRSGAAGDGCLGVAAAFERGAHILRVSRHDDVVGGGVELQRCTEKPCDGLAGAVVVGRPQAAREDQEVHLLRPPSDGLLEGSIAVGDRFDPVDDPSCP